MTPQPPAWDALTPGSDGLVPAIVQDTEGTVRMLGYMNREAFEVTKSSGFVTFWSRSRKGLWTKGETSGNRLAVTSITADCDGDALLVRAVPDGPTCHTGTNSCFGQPASRFGFLDTLWSVIASRVESRPAGSYTSLLAEAGPDLAARKVVEEAVEVLIAAKNHATGENDDQRLAEEVADVVYHLLVVLAERGVDPAQATAELRRRHES